MTARKQQWAACTLLTFVKEPGKKVRGTFPRFMVVADGESTSLNNLKQLSSLLEVIYAPAPRVFVNAGKGITIDFDFVSKAECAHVKTATTTENEGHLPK